MDDTQLADLLATVGSLPRLALLRKLQVPRALREIDVEGARPDAGGTLSRQSVRVHLDRLIEAELVVALDAERDYGPTREFLVNHARIYAIGEEVKALSRHRAAVEAPVPTSTFTVETAPDLTGPRLVVAKGLDEGQGFSLAPPDGAAPASWVIGRRRGVEVALDFDPYVSAENSVIEWRNGSHALSDIQGSRNGTTVNFRRLAPGQSRRLAHGDLIGVGRSALVYWT